MSIFSYYHIDVYLLTHIADTETYRKLSIINKYYFKLTFEYLLPFRAFYSRVKNNDRSGKWNPSELVYDAALIGNANIAKYIYSTNKYINLKKIASCSSSEDIINWLRLFDNIFPKSEQNRDNFASITKTPISIINEIHVIHSRKYFEWMNVPINQIDKLWNTGVLSNNDLLEIFYDVYNQPYFEANFDLALWICTRLLDIDAAHVESIKFASCCYKGELPTDIDPMLLSNNAKIFGFKGACINGYADIVQWILDTYNVSGYRILSIIKAGLIDSVKVFEILIDYLIRSILLNKKELRNIALNLIRSINDYDNSHEKISFLKIIDRKIGMDNMFAFIGTCYAGYYKELNYCSVLDIPIKYLIPMFELVCEKNYIEIFKFLMDKKVKYDLSYLLYVCTRYDSVEIYQYLVTHNQPISLKICIRNYTDCINYGSIRLVKWIIAHILVKVIHVNKSVIPNNIQMNDIQIFEDNIDCFNTQYICEKFKLTSHINIEIINDCDPCDFFTE